MLDTSFIKAYLHDLPPEQLQEAFARFLPEDAATAQHAIETALRSTSGPLLREQVGRWIVEKMVPVEALVPAAYVRWRPPVRDAMRFVVSRLSAARLAPKILEQIRLPSNTTPEARLLRLIAKVPGLQKLGQVLARNRHLGKALRDALSELENGIRDVEAEDICAIIRRELGPRLDTFAVQIQPEILSEASVSAVVRFTWENPENGRREEGVFKVLKPHIPACFAEDMKFLQELAQFFASRHREYGFAPHVLTDTFGKVRTLLRHEVDFPREQATLRNACELYRSIHGVRVPRLVQPLCTPTITAMTEEHGVKVTSSVAHTSARHRARVAGQLIEALVAVPLFAADANAIFHADPHAGNLFYNDRTGELILLDWALTECLSRKQRRHLALLVFMVALRDPVGVCEEIHSLSQRKVKRKSKDERVIRDFVNRFLDEIPLKHLPGAVDAMVLLERLAVEGIRFPAPLIMFSKVLFTLDGILEDIVGPDVSISFTIARHVAQRWLTNRKTIASPITLGDLAAVQCSAALYSGRIIVHLEQSVLDRLLPAHPAEPAGSV